MIQQRNQMLFFKRKYMYDKAQAFQLLVDFPPQQTDPLILMWLLKNLSKIKVITFLQCYEFCEKAIITFCVILPTRENFDAPSIYSSSPEWAIRWPWRHYNTENLRFTGVKCKVTWTKEAFIFGASSRQKPPFFCWALFMFPPAHRL